MNAVTESTALAVPAAHVFSLAPRNMDEAFRLADMLANSDMVPKDFRGKPGNVLIAIQWGQEVGLKPLQSLQNIAVINGRPSMWGDALIALVRASPLCEYILEEESAAAATCRVKRRGEPEQTRTFSDQDAKVAGLWGKTGPWTTSPRRMKQMRARSFALRDVFPDVLKGMDIAEVVLDYTELSPAASEAVAVPPELLSAGKAEAAKGVEAYRTWWAGLTKEQRHLLQFEHDAFKVSAKAADEARSTPVASVQMFTGGGMTAFLDPNKKEDQDPSNDDFRAALDAAETP